MGDERVIIAPQDKLAGARTLLFVPGDRPERFGKAWASDADMVILDLEDAVAASAKSEAREAVVAALADPTVRARTVVRINAAATSWHRDDLGALATIGGLGGVMVPKAERADQTAFVQRLVAAVPIIALVESVCGLFGMRVLLKAGGVARVAFGSVDFCLDTGIEDDGGTLDAVRAQIVLESRYAGLPAPIDGVSLVLDDAELLHAAAVRSRRHGFGGKMCVHPRQVDPVNRAFTPDAAAIDWAMRVVSAGGVGGGAGSIDGMMIDRPVIERAKSILAKAEGHSDR